MTNGMAASATTPASAGAWLTTTNLVLIAIGVVLALLVIWWGARLKRQRKAVETVIQDRAEDAGERAPIATRSLDETPPPAPETEAMIAPPVAPAPPPLAGDATPVVATAPFDAAPATEAASLAETPVEAEPEPAPAPVTAAPPAPTPAAAPTADGADDLTQLKGVGPKLAARLGELGIMRFAQVAALSPADADALDAQLGTFRGRLTRDRWVEQAGYLAKGDRAGFEAAFGKL